MGQGEPALPILGRSLRLRVEAVLLLALPLTQVGHVHQAVLVEVRPVVQHLDDVRPRARWHGRRDAGLEIVGVDELENHLGAQRLGGLGRLPLQLHVARWDEVDPAEYVEPRALREGGRATGPEDPLQRRRRGHTGGRACEKPPTRHAGRYGMGTVPWSLHRLSSSRLAALLTRPRSSAGLAGATPPGGGSEGDRLSPRLASAGWPPLNSNCGPLRD